MTPGTKQHPFRRAVLRGLALILPPLLTIVVFLWAWNTIESYVLVPVETGARHAIVLAINKSLARVPPAEQLQEQQRDQSGQVVAFRYDNTDYVQLGHGSWIPRFVMDEVRGVHLPPTVEAHYHHYVERRYLRRTTVIPVFLGLFVLFLYLLGKFLAAGLGRMLWNFFEGLIHRLPLIRNVYSSVKQVTDFIFSERELEYTRVVAVEYPRKGMWSLGFVTGESMLDIRSAANEPVLSVLIPTSPMPATGFTVTVTKSETIDLNVTVDQAIQFLVSCGVVVPVHQQHRPVEQALATAVAQREEARLHESPPSREKVPPKAGGSEEPGGRIAQPPQPEGGQQDAGPIVRPATDPQ